MTTQSYNREYEFIKYKNDFGFGETYKRISNISDDLFPRNTEHINVKNSNQINYDKKYILNENGAKLKVFLFGDSYVHNIFVGGFKDVSYFTSPLQVFIAAVEKEISSINPDVVMIIYSQNFELIKNWYDNE